MLGLCWTPPAIQNMHKVATTVPSNPEQLLGAILVRKDIFYRFETTMNDTCLDANNLLEYLFSLYNSTAAPAERENFPSPQSLGYIRRDTNHSKKGTGRGQYSFSQPNIANSQLPQSSIQGKFNDSRRGHQAGVNEGHRKKIKLEPAGFHGNTNFVGQNCSQSPSLKLFTSGPVFPGVNDNLTASAQREQTVETESRHPQSTSPLPPFSQIRRQSSRSYSPASAQYPEALTTPPHDDSHQKLGLEVGADTSARIIKEEIDETLQRMLGHQQAAKSVPVSSKHSRKRKLKGSRAQQVEGLGSGEITGRRKKMHQCFCGAMFTRADNLKRHVRKCHEEKLEKLSGVPLDFNTDNNNLATVTDFSSAFSSSGPEGIDPSHPRDTEDPQDQQQGNHDQQQDDDVIKSVDGVKWSCFCGESFDDRHQLVEHTRTHETNT